MKWIGALIVICCTTLYGLHYARKLSERPRQIRQLRTALQALEAEILFGQTPLAKACMNIAGQLKGPISYFFAEFAKHLDERQATARVAWEEAVDKVWPQTALMDSEREVLVQFGATLGTMDRNQQEKQLKLALTHLERDELEAKELQVRYEKMVKTLGVLAGLLIIILMV
ncbi:stage III sporulation protein SpoIIIAB [Bacillus sp. JCM 19041]|uniref:stage III sporulation protein SpoIIIAB n=1 Tax=Bacillus sp. JCM 19041 TaxID=1460637 RepID=UPI0006D0E537